MKRAVICFTRVPVPGKTKTRLMPLLGGKNCARLHTAFLQDLAGVYRQLDADLFVAYAPEPHWEPLREIFPFAKAFLEQQGADLGQRMDNALRWVLAQGYAACVLTGSDLPLLGKAHFEAAFAALEGADLVIGPSRDEGYYLIGMKRPCTAIFVNQHYGGATVYEQTCRAAERVGRTIQSTLPCEDVDTPGDLQRLWRTAAPGSHTAALLRQLVKEGYSFD